MRNEIIDIKDLTDSREVMMKKAPPAMTIFIAIVASILVVAIIWSCFGKIDTYVNATGEVRTEYPESTITLTSSGKIEKILLDDGSTVKKGDTILEFDDSYYSEQKNNIEAQISTKKSDIDKYTKLIKAIKDDQNLFDEKTEAVFYYQFKNYQLESNSAAEQISSNTAQISATREELEQNIAQTTKTMQDTETLHDEFSKLYDSINKDTQYTGDNQIILNLYNSYNASHDKAQAIYDNALLLYNNLIKVNTENPNSISQNEISQAEATKNAALADLNSVKTSTLSDISTKLLELEQQIDVYKANIESYNLKIKNLATNGTAPTSLNSIKNSYYATINNSIKALENEIATLENQKLEIDEALSNFYLKAEQNGVLMYNENLAEGDIISAGTTIANIIPETNCYTIILYIPEYKISEVKVGQKVEYSFNSISKTDFGKVYGELLSVSKDSFLNQADGQKYYKATSSIKKTELENDKGEKRNIQVGMNVEVHIITGSQKIIVWLLDKLNFM